jgi:hypothetical protein
MEEPVGAEGAVSGRAVLPPGALLVLSPVVFSIARPAAVPGGLAAVPSEFCGYAPDVLVPSVRSSNRVAAVPGGLAASALGAIGVGGVGLVGVGVTGVVGVPGVVDVPLPCPDICACAAPPRPIIATVAKAIMEFRMLILRLLGPLATAVPGKRT